MRRPLPFCRWLPTVGAVGLLAVLAACGTGARASTTGSTAPTSAPAATTGASGPSGASGNGFRFTQLTDAQRAELKAYSDCLTQHGVTIQRLVRLASGQGFRGANGGPDGASGASGATGPTGPTGPTGTDQPGGGFNGPPAGGTATTIDQTAFKAADAACAAERPADIDVPQLLQPRGGFGGGANGANAGAFRAYVSCLADHGVKVTPPTTTATTAGSSSSSVPVPLPSFDRNDPNFAAANQICRTLLPNGGQFDPGRNSTTTSTTQS